MLALSRSIVLGCLVGFIWVGLIGCGGNSTDPATLPASSAAEDQPVPEDVPEPAI